MTIILIILLCSIICALLIIPTKITKRKVRIKIDHNEHYKIPPIFWDEYNWLSLKIHRMTRQDCDTVQHNINQFMYKYEQLIDYKVYNERVSQLLSDYQFRVSLLLNNKHLENGTSV